MLDTTCGHFDRATAGKLLGACAVDALRELFFEQTAKDDLYLTALTLETLNDRRAVPWLIPALLEGDNPHRRHAAARALGWIRPASRSAARALARCLVDPSQPQPAREEAAESLAYAGNAGTIDALISVLGEADVRIRFWAVFGLGGSCRGDARAVRALESMLDDGETPPGNWWPVGKEALTMLGGMHPPVGDYRARLKAEMQRVRADPNASEEERRWAELYGPPTESEIASSR
jgi:HEAT repeat protein